MARPVKAPARPDPAALKRHVGKLLRHTFGLKAMREGQEAVIESVMAGKPTIAVMPTGAGKSLCYQLPALLLAGTTIVVSPLIALMKDQRDKLLALGVSAWQFNSAIDAQERHAGEAAVAAGEAKIVFTTPERLADPAFLQMIGASTVSLLVIDEAHCISQWGHDFRPDFLEVGAAVPNLGSPRILALTATASDAVVADIARQLGVARFGVVHTALYRANLRYAVQQVTNEQDQLARTVEFVQANAGCGIVYAATVKAAEAIHAALLAVGVEASLYHGRVGALERRERQEAFMAGRSRVMVATNAFGLGIDKPDLRFVLHAQVPSGIDAYYQESGRAGRDGEPAVCTLVYLHSDRAVQLFFLAGKYPSQADLGAICRALTKAPPDGGAAWTLDALLESLERPRSKLQVALRLLRHEGVVDQDRHGALRLTRQGLDEAALEALLGGYRSKRESDRSFLERMVFYAHTGHCRWRVILESLAEPDVVDACGHCDNCVMHAERTADPLNDDTARDAPPHEPAERHSPTVAPFARNDRVRVRRYGPGTVDAVGGGQITVRFANGERKDFLPDFVKRDHGRRRPEPSPSSPIG